MNTKANIRLLGETAKLDLTMVDEEWTDICLPCELASK